MLLAFYRVNLGEMSNALKEADYEYVFLGVFVYFLGVFLRALRWRYLLGRLRRFDVCALLSPLIIGYMANTLLPAHLGEIIRAYMLSEKEKLPVSTGLASIVMERIIDVFTLVALMALTARLYPFPVWLKKTASAIFLACLGVFLLLVFLKRFQPQIARMLKSAFRGFSIDFQKRSDELVARFADGIVPLRRWVDYGMVSILSLCIWACYGLVIYLGLRAFHFIQIFDLPWSVSLILLVITTIAIIVPSSPGYIGTYHYLCQIGLGMFGVPLGPALSFAFVVHGINFFPVVLVGLGLWWYEGVVVSRAWSEAKN